MSNTATIATPAQPQTTVEPSSGPFIRHSEPGKARIYDVTNLAFGGLVSQPLVAIPGYAARFRTRFVASGGVNSSTANTAGTVDAPYNVAQLITLWDALGTTIFSLPGYEGLKLVPLYSGGFGCFDGTQDVANLPSFSGIGGGTASAVGTGNFTFNSSIPLEFAKGYGCLGMADGDVLPKLQVQLNASSSVYITAPVPTLPTVEFRLNADFYWLPQGQDIAPPGLGSTRQWFLQQGNPSVANGATATVTIPRQGGYLDTIILVFRDSTNVRVDAWPSIFRFALDGIGEISVNMDEIYDDMAISLGVGALTATSSSDTPRPVGTICITRKTSLGQRIFGLLDSLETVLSTSPGTAMTVEGAPWGTVSNSPGLLNGILGQIIPD